MAHDLIIRDGIQEEVHLCLEHSQQGKESQDLFPFTIAHSMPIAHLLTQFISGKFEGVPQRSAGSRCPDCGMRFAELQQTNMVGCPHCYDAFEEPLAALMERIHNRATSHVGKIPHRGAGSIERQVRIRLLARDLDEAVATEQYEQAAELRDAIESLRTSSGTDSQEPGVEGAA